MKSKVLLIMQLLVLTEFCYATIRYEDGQIHNISTTVNDTIEIDPYDYAAGRNTTVNWLDGASTQSGVNASQDARINVYGGEMHSYLDIDDRAIGNIFGGYIETIDNRATTYIHNGHFERLYGSGSYSNSVTEVYDGVFDGSVIFSEGAEGTIYGGNFYNNISQYYSGIFEINRATVDIYGGQFHEEVRLKRGSTVTFYGSSFMLDGQPIDYGMIGTITGAGHLYYQEPLQRLQGQLASGEWIDLNLRITYDTDQVILAIPEPCTLAFLALGGLLLRKRKA